MTDMRKRILKMAAALALALLLGCSGQASRSTLELSGPDDGPSREIISSDWMALISDNTMISQLTIPGTHDTCTYTQPEITGAGFVKTQELSIDEQLNAGIRFLDIRGRLYKDSLVIHHGPYYLERNFSDVIEMCKAFLRDHPAETILMSVKDEYDHYDSRLSYYQTFLKYYDENESLWHIGTTIPALGQVRGKIVLLRRFALDPGIAGLGIDLAVADNSRSFSHTFSTNPEQTLYGEDLYTPGIFSSYDEKESAIRENVSRAQSDSSPNNLYLTFTSATQVALLDKGTPLFFASVINPWLMSALEVNKGRMGIIPMDFPEFLDHKKLIKFFIYSNFPKSGGSWILSSDGGIHTYGDAGYYGHGIGGDSAAVALGVTASGRGYWILSRNGGIHTYGDAGYHGHGIGGDSAAVALGVTPSGNGYWILSRNGGIHTYGDAVYHGHGVGGDSAAVALGVTPSGRGYWILSSNGGIHTYGDAGYYGHGIGGDSAAVALGITLSGRGYWILSSNGGIHTYGDAVYYGHEVGSNDAAIAFGVTPSGNGYWILTSAAKIIPFGDAGFWGEGSGINATGLAVRR